MGRCHVLLAIVGLTLGVGACGGSPSTPSPVSAPLPSPGASIPGVGATGPTGQVSGVVVDTQGHPIAGAFLRSALPDGRVATETDSSGAFSFAYPLASRTAVLVTAASHESATVAWKASADPVALRIVLQRTIVIAVGTGVTTELTNGDTTYAVGDDYDSEYCRPCKLIWIHGEPQSATLHWTGGDDLQLWASNGTDVRRAQAAGERSQVVGLKGATRLYVGLPLVDYRQPQQLQSPAIVEISLQ